MFKKIKNWFLIPPSTSANDPSATGLIDNTIKNLAIAIEYNNKVIAIAVVSMFLWVVLMIICAVYKHSTSEFYQIKYYPAPVWALITGAFSEIEKLEKRKQLNTFINSHVNTENAPFKKHMEDSIWDEYKNLE